MAYGDRITETNWVSPPGAWELRHAFRSMQTFKFALGFRKGTLLLDWLESPGVKRRVHNLGRWTYHTFWVAEPGHFDGRLFRVEVRMEMPGQEWPYVLDLPIIVGRQGRTWDEAQRIVRAEFTMRPALRRYA